MRWKLFRRSPEEDAADSVFESTVVEDLSPGLTLPEGGVPSPGEATSRAAVNIGHVGRYALKSVLGEGGLGTVYAAWDPLLSRAVAVKTLHLHGDADTLGALDDLILNEARAAARLSHPHIVTIHDAGSSQQGIYIAMEPLRGRDLRHLLREGWRPSPVETAHLVRRVADALAYAHSRGVIHCDIKPANIFMVGRKQPKVLDFGIARVTHRDAPATDGPMAGSPYYLAPEQLRGEAVDRRSDVYSLGVVMFELLTGQRPFSGHTMAEISNAVREAPTPIAHAVNARVPPTLSAIAAQAMARAAGDRYPSARHLSTELRHWLDSPEAHALGEPASSRNQRHKAMAGVVGGALLAAGATAWLQGRWMEPAAPVTAVAPGLSAASSAASAPLALHTSGNDTAAGGTRPAAVDVLGQPDLPTPTADGAAGPSPSAAHPAQPVAGADRSVVASPARSNKARAPRERNAGSPPDSVTVIPQGVVRLAISPWGQVEVDGNPVGIAPPLTQLTLSAGTHTVTVTNGDLPVFTRTITVSADAPVTVQHRFGP